MNMGRVCFVCNSPHRSEYDKMRLDGKSIKEIHAFSHNTYNENHLEYFHFQKHFMNHVTVLVDEQVKASKLRDQVVKEYIKKDIEIARQLHKNLEIVADKIDEKSKNMDNPNDEEMFLKFATESRMIIDQFLKWGEKLSLQETDEDVFDKILKCMANFPPDLIQQFIERWKTYGQNIKIS